MRARDYAAEFVGTFLLLLIGLSAVVLFFSRSSPIPGRLPDGNLRRLFTGMIFAGGATAIVYSPLGKTSGGHINPAVTLGFYRLKKMTGRSALGYVGSQFAGALSGALAVRLLWGRWATDVHVGATLPGRGGWLGALAAEVVITFLLVTVILRFVDDPGLQRFTPVAAGALVAFLVFVEAPVSGTSLNPARSLGPAIVAVRYGGIWIYLLAPPVGALLAVGLYRRRRASVACGKLIHSDRYACPFLDCERSARPQEVGASRPEGPGAVTTGARAEQ